MTMQKINKVDIEAYKKFHAKHCYPDGEKYPIKWTEFVSDELKQKLSELKSDNGMVPFGTVDEIIKMFVENVEYLGNELEKYREYAD